MGQGVLIANVGQDSVVLPAPLAGSLGPGQSVVVNSTVAILASFGLGGASGAGTLRFRDLGATYAGPYDATHQGVLNPDGTIAAAGSPVFDADTTGQVDVSAAFAVQAPIAAAAEHARLIIPQGQFRVAHPLIMPWHTTTELTSGTVLRSYQTADVPAEDHNVFYSASGSRGDGGVPSQVIDTGSLHATPTQATPQTISFAGAIKPVAFTATTAGNYIELRRDAGGLGADVNKQQVFRIEEVTGASSPWTVTLDRVIGWPYVSGDTALTLAAIPEALAIDGNNAQIHFVTGGDSPVQFFESRDFGARYLVCDANATTTGFGGVVDLGCYRGSLTGCVFRGFTHASTMSSAEDLDINLCTFEGSTNVVDGAGLRLWDSLNGRVRNSRSSNNLYGAVTDSNGGTFGGDNLLFHGDDFDNNSITNIAFSLGSNITVRDCTGRNGNIGLTAAAAVKNLFVDGLNLSGNVNNPAIVASADARLSHLTDVRVAANAADLQVLGDGGVVDGGLLDMTALAGGGGITGWHFAGTLGYCRNSTIILGNNTYGIYAAAGTTRISGVRFKGADGSPVIIQSGATAIFDRTCDFGTLFANILIVSGGLSNVGPVASLPTALVGGRPGEWGYATNGRKTGEAPGTGTGVPVYQSANATWYTDLGVAVAA